jgi:hypothetical protein
VKEDRLWSAMTWHRFGFHRNTFTREKESGNKFPHSKNRNPDPEP